MLFNRAYESCTPKRLRRTVRLHVLQCFAETRLGSALAYPVRGDELVNRRHRWTMKFHEAFMAEIQGGRTMVL